MISVQSRQLIDVSYLPDLGAFTGHVSLTYCFDDDPEFLLTVRLPATLEIDPRTRFNRIENALIAAATQALMDRFQSIGAAPANIFCDAELELAA